MTPRIIRPKGVEISALCAADHVAVSKVLHAQLETHGVSHNDCGTEPATSKEATGVETIRGQRSFVSAEGTTETCSNGVDALAWVGLAKSVHLGVRHLRKLLG